MTEKLVVNNLYCLADSRLVLIIYLDQLEINLIILDPIFPQYRNLRLADFYTPDLLTTKISE